MSFKQSIKLKVGNTTRGLIFIFVIASSLPFLIWLIAVNESLILLFLGLILIVIINLLAFYAYSSWLNITIDKEKLTFSHDYKAYFTFAPVPEIKYKDIYTIVVNREHNLDEGRLYKIKTDKGSYRIQVLMQKGADSNYLMSCLIAFSKNAKVIDTWDEWNLRGWLRPTYYISSVLLLGALTILLHGIFIVGISNLSPQNFIPFALAFGPTFLGWHTIHKKLFGTKNEK